MTEQDKQVNSELNASDLSDTSSAEASTSIDFDAEESNNDLDLDKELSTDDQGKTSEADIQREKQVESWEARLEAGEVNKADIPKWVQKRIDFKENEPDMDSLIDAKVEARLAEKEDAREATKIKQQLSKITVSKDQKAKLLSRYNSLKGKIPESEALKIAIETAGITFDSDKQKPQASMPVPGKGEADKMHISADSTWKEVQASTSEEERREVLIKQSQY